MLKDKFLYKGYFFIVISFLTVLSLSSCFNEKKFAYFQKKGLDKDTISTGANFVAKIQTGDLVSVYVSSLSSSASSFFNPYTATASVIDGEAGSGQTNSPPALSQSSSPGFLVDSSGTIEIPLIGMIHISGLTTSEAKDVIRTKMVKYLKEPTVNVRVLNYKISILGEVNKPSVYVIPNAKVTIIEALSMAGDLTVFGDREDVLIVRDVDGKKEFGHLNMTTRDIYNSRFYNLHPNDIIYIKPLKVKSAQTNVFMRVLPLAISILSVLIIVLTQL